MARRHSKEGGNHIKQETNRQRTMEGTDGGLHPAVVGHSLGEGEGEVRGICLVTKLVHRNALATWNSVEK